MGRRAAEVMATLRLCLCLWHGVAVMRVLRARVDRSASDGRGRGARLAQIVRRIARERSTGLGRPRERAEVGAVRSDGRRGASVIIARGTTRSAREKGPTQPGDRQSRSGASTRPRASGGLGGRGDATLSLSLTVLCALWDTSHGARDLL